MAKILRPGEISNNLTIDEMANLNTLAPYVSSKMSEVDGIVWLDIKPNDNITAMISVGGDSANTVPLNVVKIGLDFNYSDKVDALLLRDRTGESHDFKNVVEVFASTKLF